MLQVQRIGVVGCGVAGASAAAFLARDGHEVTVLEQSPVLDAVGAGILLQKSGQYVLEQLGLLEQVLARSAILEELYARHRSGRTLIRTRYQDYKPGHEAYGVHRGVIFAALRKRLDELGVEIVRGCRCEARETDQFGEWVLDEAGRRHGPFDLLVIADGSRSKMRTACGLDARVVEYEHGTLWFIAPVEVPGRLLQVVRGCRQLFGLMPMGDGLCTMYWGLPKRDLAGVRQRGLEALKAEILEFARESEPVLEQIVDMDQLLFTSYRHVWMRKRWDSTAMFLGDAAHAMSPHLGQGMNLALVDALLFSRCLRNARDRESAFQAFERERMAYLKFYLTMTFSLSPFFQSDWAMLSWGRDLVLPLMPRIPWVRRQMLMTVVGLKNGFFGGEITL